MSQLSSQDIHVLTNNILSQAKYFLSNAGEFYPFGVALDKNNNIKPIGIYFGDEYPDSSEVLIPLEDGIKKGIKNNEYISAAIGVDVYINVNNGEVSEKKPALEIRVYDAHNFIVRYFLYYKQASEYIFQPFQQ